MDDRVNYLYQQYIDDKCTEAEREEFFSLLDATAESETINELLDQHWYEATDHPTYKKEQANRILNQILTAHPKPVVKQINLYYYVVAAALALIIGTVVYFYQTQSTLQKQARDLAQQTIKPGTNKAVLTLANGSVIELDNQANGQVAQQAGISITKTADGQLVYDMSQPSDQSEKTDQPVINTISTPKGGQYQITLPDGTKVWLNAASSLKYPAIFSQQERRVELTGEAYFEVAHNKSKPFTVQTVSNGVNQEIQVLGTHFNINAYDDEASSRTTLLEGSVRVSLLSAQKAVEVLKPGQQAVLDNNKIKVAEVDTEEVIAWKSGFFQFNEADLRSITRQLSRWYNIEVVFEGKPSNDLFHFKISKNLSLSQVLKIFEANGINFKIEGRKLIVKS